MHVQYFSESNPKVEYTKDSYIIRWSWVTKIPSVSLGSFIPITLICT